MRVVLLVEGEVEYRLVLPFVRRCLERRLPGGPRPKLDWEHKPGAARLLQDLPKQAVAEFASPRPPLLFGCLLDLYGCPIASPVSNEPAAVAAEIRRSIERHDARAAAWTRVYFAVHEVEAWLLSAPDLFPHGPIRDRVKALSANPETVNHARPPFRRLNEIYRTGRQQGYHKIRDGQNLWSRLDPQIAEKRCPNLKLLIDDLVAAVQNTSR